MDTRTYEDLKLFVKRRQDLAQRSESSVFVIFSGKDKHLGAFRASSSFIYLTGFEEPDACLVFRSGADPQYVLFVRDKDPVAETWEGYRYGPDEAQKIFGCDKAYSISQLESELPQLLSGSEKIYFDLGLNEEHDRLLLAGRKSAQALNRRSGLPLLPIHETKEVLGEMRVVKTPEEIEWMKEACDISVKAHREAMKSTRVGKNERQIHGQLLYHFFQGLASREGYSSIVASGENATVLHYRDNRRDMQDGDLLLIDAGAEKNYYTADITRTYPVNGKFSEAQKNLYQAVLSVQENLIPLAQPGFSLPQLQEKAIELLTEQMVELGLLRGRPQDLIADKKYQKYYPHGIGHYLGMDVHDVGRSKEGSNPIPFQENMVITIEPGIYIPKNDSEAPKELRGLGVRIEDDVQITSKDPFVLTGGLEKSVADLESLINS